MPNGTENSRNFQISGKSDTLERLTKIFEMNFAKILVSYAAVFSGITQRSPFDSVPEFPEFLVEWKAPIYLRAPENSFPGLSLKKRLQTIRRSKIFVVAKFYDDVKQQSIIEHPIHLILGLFLNLAV